MVTSISSAPSLPEDRLKFQVLASAEGSAARAGVLLTARGAVPTPIFMPVGTHGSVRWHDVDTLSEINAGIILANTYHLLLKPGPERVARFGGLHRFISWQGGILTDSGGYQIFSIPHTRTISEEGAVFRSYLDGTKVLLSPEVSIATQRALGSDIMMVLDVCIPSLSSRDEARLAMDRTHRWALRSLAARSDSSQALFAIVQGAMDESLRRESAEFLTAHCFDGYAIGGLAVGESKDDREAMTGIVAALLPENRPRYLMGVGMPIDLLEAVHRGVDMFDCILPTALGEQGVVFTAKGKLNLRRSVYADANSPIDEECHCRACRIHSRGYLHHLLKSREPLVCYLLSGHNLHFYSRLMRNMREAIVQGRFGEFYRQQRERLILADPEYPPQSAPRQRPSLTRGRFEVVVKEIGSDRFGAIRDRASGETMHPGSSPIVEARALYVEQAGFAERITNADTEALVIWDVGLGAATNAMAVLSAYEEEVREKGTRRSVHLVSFECDLDPLLLALTHQNLFAHLRHPAPHSLAKNPFWRGMKGRFSWQLLRGDFFTTMAEAPDPDLIMYDPFSYKVDYTAWTAGAFGVLHERISARKVALYTYSAATRVRAAMLHAGFFVGAGAATGAKGETTVALTKGEVDRSGVREALLGGAWLERWERSDARYPIDVEGAEEGVRALFAERVRGHEQFGGGGSLRGKLPNAII